jgi:purine-nucleoside phosphorylase
MPIRVFAQAGMKQVIVTAAAGAINEKYKVGDFVVLSDLLTLFLSVDNPLIGPTFTDMSQCFDEELRQRAIKACANNEIPFHEGVYAYAHGPHFETPADKMALKFLGADVVGMSTVPETIMARSLGVKVLGLAYVTNLAFVKHEHKDVLAAAEKGSSRMVSLLKDLV